MHQHACIHTACVVEEKNLGWKVILTWLSQVSHWFVIHEFKRVMMVDDEKVFSSLQFPWSFTKIPCHKESELFSFITMGSLSPSLPSFNAYSINDFLNPFSAFSFSLVDFLCSRVTRTFTGEIEGRERERKTSNTNTDSRTMTKGKTLKIYVEVRQKERIRMCIR